MNESYHNCTIEGDFKVLLRNFYVGLTLSHRQLLDFAAKGNFIEIDPSFAYEIIEGIVGVLPPPKGLTLIHGVKVPANIFKRFNRFLQFA